MSPVPVQPVGVVDPVSAGGAAPADRDPGRRTRWGPVVDRWVRPVFAEESAGSRQVRGVWVVAGAAIASIVFALRLPVDRWDALWAEDGYTFLQAAIDRPWHATLFEPYAGYFHLLPRLAAEAAVRLPLPLVPYAFVTVAASVVGVVSALAWRFSAGHLRSPVPRLLLAAAVVLVPGGALEAVGNVANSHFFLTFAAFWILLGRPRSPAAVTAGTLTVVLAALSDPLTLVLAPLALARLLLGGPRRDLWAPVGYLLAGLVQLVGLLGAGRESGGPSPLDAIVFGYEYRVAATGLLGVRLADALHDGSGALGMHVLAVGLLGAILAVALRGHRHRLVTVAALVLSVTYFVVPSVFTLAGGLFPPVGGAVFDLAVGGRYSVLPVLLLFSALLLALDRGGHTRPAGADRETGGTRATAAPGTRARWLLPAVPLVLWSATDYTAPATLRTLVQPWSVSVDYYEVTCAALPADTLVPLPVEPGGPTWFVVIPCSARDGLL